MKPFTLKILGKTVKVEHKNRNDMVGNSGLAHPAKLLIYVADDLPKDEVSDTQLHEVIHILDYMLDTELQESQVHRLATGLLAFFKDNPKYYDRWIR